MEQVKLKIRNYLLKELQEIGKPKNPSKNQVYRFSNLEGLIDVLFKLLDAETSESTLQRIGENFYYHALRVVEFREDLMPIAIEGLATNFEPFLKLIAYLRYGDNEIWLGDDSFSNGISKTCLGNLISGKIDNKISVAKDIQLKGIPDPLIDYSGLKRNILDFVRTDLRNQVHNAVLYNRMELLYYSNLVLSCYLFAVEHNSLFLKTCLFEEYKYLKRIITDSTIQHIDKIYVELFGQGYSNDIEVTGSQLVDETDLLENINSVDYLIDVNLPIQNINELQNKKRVDGISRIASDTIQFEIIGKAGSGKSTTLQKILFEGANEILSGKDRRKIPILINANEYRPNNNFLTILSNQFDRFWLNKQLSEGNLQILIDGLNEITEKYKYEAYKEVSTLLKEYSKNSFIISERATNFERHFNIPVFELQDLNYDQIQTFIKNYLGKKSERIWTQMIENAYMMQLASNPLMLKIILAVCRENEVPQNRGLLLKLFINLILKRESLKKEQIDKTIKIEVLAFIAFNMLLKGEVNLNINKFKNLLTAGIQSLNSTISTNLLFKELIENLIIKVSQNENVLFTHEIFQEYFCAVRLRSDFEVNEELNIDIKESKWLESLLICSELFRDSRWRMAFFEYLFKGSIKAARQKELKAFSQEDFNDSINVACKIAHSLKGVHPSIYDQAENYLKNYLILWKYVFYETDTPPTSIESLFAAVASLNSEKIISYVIFNFGWARIWLYSADEDKIDCSFKMDRDPEKDESERKITQSIIENTPYFANFYDLIRKALNEYYFSRSIIRRLHRLSNQIIQDQPVNKLRNYYETTLDFHIFIEILKKDVTIIRCYDFSLHDEKDNCRVLKILTDYHHFREYAQKIVVSELLRFNYGLDFTNSRLNKFYIEDHIDCYLNSIVRFATKDRNIIKKNLYRIQSIPFIQLPDILRNEFIQLQKLNVPYFNYCNSTFCLDGYYKKYFTINDRWRINDKHLIEIDEIRHPRRSAILVLVTDGTYIKDIQAPGKILINYGNTEELLDFDKVRITRSNDKIEFRLSEVHNIPEGVDKSCIKLTVNQTEGWSCLFRTKLTPYSGEIDPPFRVIDPLTVLGKRLPFRRN